MNRKRPTTKALKCIGSYPELPYFIVSLHMKRAAAAWRYESLVSRRCGEDWQKQSFQTARALLRPAKM
ncbi:hypothetical protein, partial [Segatella baroniae]|uniref:hypothetical protein n=1 Tax=Segatella baroniae TaxID=305719 RepID=UPI001F160832